jgi:hypothetical protein
MEAPISASFIAEKVTSNNLESYTILGPTSAVVYGTKKPLCPIISYRDTLSEEPEG